MSEAPVSSPTPESSEPQSNESTQNPVNSQNIAPQKIHALNYWKLSAFSESEIKAMAKNNEEVAIMISAAKAGLERLFDYFADEKNGYVAAFNSRNEYSHLARIF